MTGVELPILPGGLPSGGFCHEWGGGGSPNHPNHPYLYGPTPATVSLQHALCLSLRAGLHPVAVGGPEAGKRTAVAHALHCWKVYGQFK